jgi:hypothetical protein
VIGPVLAVVAHTRRARLMPRHLLGRVYSVDPLVSGSTAPALDGSGRRLVA